MATRIVVEGITRYRADRIFRKGVAEQRRWCDQVAAHSEALAELASTYPAEFEGHIMPHYSVPEDAQMAIRMLRKWAEYARSYREAERVQGIDGWALPGTKRPRKVRDMRPIELIDYLSQLYLLATGREPGRSLDREADHEAGGRWPNPFINFMEAVWRLAGAEVGREGTIHHIREWRRLRQAAVAE